MSADNGVYIGIFPTATGKEYRVIHAQAIENVEHEEYVQSYFGNAEVFSTLVEAQNRAFAIEDEILNDDFCPICEYGVCTLPEFPKPLSEYPILSEEDFENLWKVLSVEEHLDEKFMKD